MTVQNTNYRADYTGNGSTTTFSVPFYFLDDAHIKVLKTDTSVSPVTVTTLVLNSDYTVSGAGNPAGGSIICAVAPTSQNKISILRDVPYTQLTHYVPNDPFPAASHEAALDKLTMSAQQLAEQVGRAVTVPDNITGVSGNLPTPVANQILVWNETATSLQNLDPANIASVIEAGQAKADVFTGTGSQTDFALSSNPGALNNLSVSVGGVVQLPTTDYTWSGGTTLTFTSAPPSGAKVLVRYMQALPSGTGASYADLASTTDVTKGDALIGVKSILTGGVARTQHSKNADVVSVLDFGAVGDWNGSTGTDNTSAFQAAVGSGASKIVVPAGKYLVSDQITIPANGVIIEGASGTYHGPCEIILSTANKSVFFIGQGIRRFVLRDIALRCTTTVGTKGVRAYGAYPNSSFGHSFTNCSFTGFDRCISYEDAGGGWQNDNNLIQHCDFAECNYGIYFDTQNIDYTLISQCMMLVLSGGTCIYLKTCGLVTIQDVAVASLGDEGDGSCFVRIGANASKVTIEQCACESIDHGVIINGANSSATQTLIIGCVLTPRIDNQLNSIRKVTTIGNYWGSSDWNVNATDCYVDSTNDVFDDTYGWKFPGNPAGKGSSPNNSFLNTQVINGGFRRFVSNVGYFPKSITNTALTSASAQTILSAVPYPKGLFRVDVYLRVVSSSSSISLVLNWNDDSGYQTDTLCSGTQAVGFHTFTRMIQATQDTGTNGPITITATAASNYANDFVSAVIDKVDS